MLPAITARLFSAQTFSSSLPCDGQIPSLWHTNPDPPCPGRTTRSKNARPPQIARFDFRGEFTSGKTERSESSSASVSPESQPAGGRSRPPTVKVKRSAQKRQSWSAGCPTHSLRMSGTEGQVLTSGSSGLRPSPSPPGSAATTHNAVAPPFAARCRASNGENPPSSFPCSHPSTALVLIDR